MNMRITITILACLAGLWLAAASAQKPPPVINPTPPPVIEINPIKPIVPPPKLPPPAAPTPANPPNQPPPASPAPPPPPPPPGSPIIEPPMPPPKLPATLPTDPTGGHIDHKRLEAERDAAIAGKLAGQESGLDAAMGEPIPMAKPPLESLNEDLMRISRASLPPNLIPAQKAKIDQVVAALRARREAEAKQAWSEFVGSYIAVPANKQKLASVIDAILREAIVAPEELPGLQGLQELRELQELRKAIRGYLRELRTLAAECKRGAQQVQPLVLQRTPDGGERAVIGPARTMNCKELRSEMERWEAMRDLKSDSAQMAEVDLQEMLQKQQRTLQMMSQISKMLYDTAMSVIRKIGG